MPLLFAYGKNRFSHDEAQMWVETNCRKGKMWTESKCRKNSYYLKSTCFDLNQIVRHYLLFEKSEF